jgi:Methyltransferase domain
MLEKILRKLRGLKSPFVERVMSDAFQIWYDLPVAPGNYQSPLPNISDLKKDLKRWHKESSLPGVDISPDRQLAFLSDLGPYLPECQSLPDFELLSQQGYGQGYGLVEAHLLHCVIRFLKPKKVIEVGSGVSSYFIFNALQKNREADRVSSNLLCIEPYPADKLREWSREMKIELMDHEVQDVSLQVFMELGENDILFIDSTHVSKMGSDVNYLYLEVLPRLKKGVVVHIHDIPFPYLALPREHPLFDLSLLWNEPVIVRSFLSSNRDFEILICQSYLHFKCPEALKAAFDVYDVKEEFPASLWIRRIKD